jgi:DMSO/TMAO reductase YedYZ molybdopterin-dependent catalytic subunit
MAVRFKPLRFGIGHWLLINSLWTSVLKAQSATASLTLVGEGGVSRTLTGAELAALPQTEVRVRERDSSVITFRGPTIRSLITLVGAPTGMALRGPSMLLAVLAEAADGYRVAYMLAELDEQFGAREAILALTQDGQPLSARDGPLRIVVPGEEHRARWARQVQKLSLVRVGN